MTTLEVNNLIQAKVVFSVPHFHDSLTWPPAGKRLLLPVALLKSHPVPSPSGRGCLPKCHSAWIRAVGLSWSHEVEEEHSSLLPQRPCKDRRILSASSGPLRDFRGCPHSPEVPEKSCAWYQEDLTLWICLRFYQDCVLPAALLLSVALSPPALQKHFPAGHTLLLSWKANSPLPSPRAQQRRRSLFASISNFQQDYSPGYPCSK